jgi:type IX secretion system PorP/SprF family membrane protein
LKKILILLVLFVPLTLSGQQFPFMEGYNVNPYLLSPAYAGRQHANTLFIDYRSDLTGIEGSPRTYELSYSTSIRDRIGIGGRLIYDKTDIFKHTLILGTYTYRINITDEHKVIFGLSAGFYRNTIDLAKYYNDPGYVQDPVLVFGEAKSHLLFATDLSALYLFKELEAGVLFSNVMFGTVRYKNTDLRYKPLKNYLIHGSYNFVLDDKWTLKPTLVLRGGQDIPAQFEIAPAVTWNKRFWGSALFRTGRVFGVGIGGELYDGIILNYSYNIITTASLYTFGSHQLSMGIRLYNPHPKEADKK